MLVPSNMWRAAEVVSTLTEEYPGLLEAADLQDRYREVRRSLHGPAQIE
jgi:hypothetical protein